MSEPRPLGNAECQCAACGRIFTSLSGFDKHQKWTGKGDKTKLTCSDPATATNRKTSELVFQARTQRGRTVWALAGSEEALARIQGRETGNPGA